MTLFLCSSNNFPPYSIRSVYYSSDLKTWRLFCMSWTGVSTYVFFSYLSIFQVDVMFTVTVRYYYHPRMRVGNVFSCVCLCVCVSVCLSVCLSIQTVTFEPFDIETLFLACRYILTISRSSLSIKVIGSRSRSYEKNDSFTYFNFLILCMWLQDTNKVKITHQGQGHIKIKVKISSSLPTLCKIYLF